MITRRAALHAIALTLLLLSPVQAAEETTLSDEERAAGFELLLNGQDFTGWRQSGNWEYEGDAVARVKGGGDLTYVAKKVPDDFELRFEWKVAKGCNSGVYYRPGQYEYQVLDNANHRNGLNPRQTAASLFFCMAPSKDATRPVGEWNTARVICQGTVIQHWLNGEKVVDFDYTDPQWADNLAILRLRNTELTQRGAHLRLQDHGDPVWFRGLMLRALSGQEPLDRTPITPAPVTGAALEAEREYAQRAQQKRGK